MTCETDHSVLNTRFGTSTPIWSFSLENNLLLLSSSAESSVTEFKFEVGDETASQIRAITGVTSALCVETVVFGSRTTLHLVGKRVSETSWAGTAAELADSAAVARNLSGALAFAEQVVSEANTLLVILNQDGRIQRFNRHAEEAVGMKEEDLIGRNAWDLFMVGAEKEASQNNIKAFFQTGTSFEVERVVSTLKGPRLFLFRNKFALSVGWTEERYLICSGIDITEQRRAQERLSVIANTDSLTGLPNRFFMTEVLKREFFNTEHRHRFAILYIDLNNFKDINDSIGHKGGDQLIRKVANRIRGLLADGDEVMRIGGDEFVITIRHESPESWAHALAARLMKEFEVVFVLSGVSYLVNMSIGIALFCDDDATELDIMTRADQAMYAAKSVARARQTSHACSHTPELAGQADRDLQLYQTLQIALVKKEFDVFYTPIFDATSRQQTGFRARFSWQDDAGEPVPAEKTMEQADSAGLGVQVSEHLVTAVCQRLHDLTENHSSVTIDVTAHQLLRGDIGGCIGQWRDTYAFDASRIRVAVCGNLIASMTPEVETKLRSIRDAGAKVLVVLGATAPFPNFAALTVDGVIVARCLFSRVFESSAAEASVRGMLRTCEELGLTTLVCGIETSGHAGWISQFPQLEFEGINGDEFSPYRSIGSIAQRTET
ncbi:diguanylate cyclase [Burkholderia vietnamiensis]|jgi:c-di-GMP phosphodiesterase Gmr|uniref:Diguanylate cyclase n=1 Tax=Burkholderia contaminans TaxID=488447 RepID=A0AAP4VJX8_9BURK|nr:MULTISPECIES: diguanylate cyclase [Burkholderia]HDR9756537.1 diguanylate cyclase [Burkholderia cepacia ATCC 25416]MBR7917457.1 diguanylate cyclase [Burkholderia vietnamiensis]MBR8055872.1 diguanylate cyclase [Burkholderia vietnamiensis]MDN7456280.1 diguanylate cyclase [Burkholderia cenocepacia]MDN7570253.1 diguanylate cyclase [Burkholderia contaminans]